MGPNCGNALPRHSHQRVCALRIAGSPACNVEQVDKGAALTGADQHGWEEVEGHVSHPRRERGHRNDPCARYASDGAERQGETPARRDRAVWRHRTFGGGCHLEKEFHSGIANHESRNLAQQSADKTRGEMAGRHQRQIGQGAERAGVP